MDKNMRHRLSEAWKRHLEPMPSHTYIDWAVAKGNDSSAEVTALATRVVMSGTRRESQVVHVAAPLWTALREQSNILRVQHIVVAEFDDVVLYRVWPPISGVHYQVRLIEGFLLVCIPLVPEDWKEIP